MPHAGAGQGEAEGALPLQARVAGHHAGHQPQQANAAANRALAPEASKLLELEVIHMGCYESVPTQTPQNSHCQTTNGAPPEHEGVAGAAPHWGRRKDTQGGLCVAEVEPDGVRLDNGMRLKNQELLWATRPSHAVTYASCQRLTLHKRVRLDLESCTYVGASRATSSELLEA